MAKSIDRSVNEMLVNLFNSVLQTESKAVITAEYSDITENDMHIIEAIGVGEPQKASCIAKKMGVTPGTITINLKNLERKGYIIRKRGESDKRVVNASLTEKGRQTFFHHKDFHKHMIKAAVKDFNEEEMAILIRCLKKLTDFFDNYKYLNQ